MSIKPGELQFLNLQRAEAHAGIKWDNAVSAYIDENYVQLKQVGELKLLVPAHKH